MDRKTIARVSLFRNPVTSSLVFARVIAAAVVSGLSFVVSHALQCALVAGAVAAAVASFRNPPPLLAPLADAVADYGSFAGYWVVLGVLSSIGLGSGLHTFVLFLGPHIVRVTNAAVLHGNTAFSGAIDSYFKWPRSWDVPGLSEAFSPQYSLDAWASDAPRHPGGGSAAFLSIAAKVAYPAFLWGLGTALGELPPYFVARAAAASGRAVEELQEVEALEAAAVASAAEPLPSPADGDDDADGPISSGAGSSSGGGARSRRAHGSSSNSNSARKHDAASAAAHVTGRKKGGAPSPSPSPTRTVGGGAASATHPHPPPRRSLLEGAKVAVFESIQRYGFVAILLAASIPNPLFDLAGITCGHFGIPFATFFGATLLGKAIVKPAIQSSFIIGIVTYGPWAFDALRAALPAGSALARVAGAVEASLLAGQHAMCTSHHSATVAVAAAAADGDGAAAGGSGFDASACAACCDTNFAALGHDHCRNACAAAAASASGGDGADGGAGGGLGGLAKQAWGFVLVGMVVYFLLSIVDSLVRERLLEELEAAEADAALAAAAAVAEGGAPSSPSTAAGAAGLLEPASPAGGGMRSSGGRTSRAGSFVAPGTPGGGGGGGLMSASAFGRLEGAPTLLALTPPPIQGGNVIAALAHATELSQSAMRARAASAASAGSASVAAGSSSMAASAFVPSTRTTVASAASPATSARPSPAASAGAVGGGAVLNRSDRLAAEAAAAAAADVTAGRAPAPPHRSPTRSRAGGGGGGRL